MYIVAHYVKSRIYLFDSRNEYSDAIRQSVEGQTEKSFFTICFNKLRTCQCYWLQRWTRFKSSLSCHVSVSLTNVTLQALLIPEADCDLHLRLLPERARTNRSRSQLTANHVLQSARFIFFIRNKYMKNVNTFTHQYDYYKENKARINLEGEKQISFFFFCVKCVLTSDWSNIQLLNLSAVSTSFTQKK